MSSMSRISPPFLKGGRGDFHLRTRRFAPTVVAGLAPAYHQPQGLLLHLAIGNRHYKLGVASRTHTYWIASFLVKTELERGKPHTYEKTIGNRHYK